MTVVEMTTRWRQRGHVVNIENFRDRKWKEEKGNLGDRKKKQLLLPPPPPPPPPLQQQLLLFPTFFLFGAKMSIDEPFQ